MKKIIYYISIPIVILGNASVPYVFAKTISKAAGENIDKALETFSSPLFLLITIPLFFIWLLIMHLSWKFIKFAVKECKTQ